jgi:hypothetical protein
MLNVIIFHMLAYSLFNLNITIDDVYYDHLYELLKEYAIMEGIEDDKKIRVRDRRNTIIMVSLYITLVILQEVFDL